MPIMVLRSPIRVHSVQIGRCQNWLQQRVGSIDAGVEQADRGSAFPSNIIYAIDHCSDPPILVGTGLAHKVGRRVATKPKFSNRIGATDQTGHRLSVGVDEDQKSFGE